MNSAEFRRLARENLRGRWGRFALVMFLYSLFTWLISFAGGMIPIIGGIASFIIVPVLRYGLVKQMVLLKSGVNVDYLDFFKFGFQKFVQVWKVYGWLMLKYIGPIILMMVAMFIMSFGITYGTIWSQSIEYASDSSNIISAIITLGTIGLSIVLYIGSLIWLVPLSLKYAFAYYELVYNPEMKAKDLIEFSGKKMIGNRWRYVKLSWSFIGWNLLACFGFGIPMLWISPYTMVAFIFFYESISVGQNRVQKTY